MSKSCDSCGQPRESQFFIVGSINFSYFLAVSLSSYAGVGPSMDSRGLCVLSVWAGGVYLLAWFFIFKFGDRFYRLI